MMQLSDELDTIGGVIRAHGELGDKPFVTIDQIRITYGEAEQRSRRLASGLLSSGVAKGSRVAMLFGNSAEFVVCFLALARIGAVALPISTLSTAPEISGIVGRADVEYVISAPDYRGRNLRETLAAAIAADLSGPFMAPDLPVMRQVWFGIEALEQSGDPDDGRVAAAEAQVSPADTLVVIHTSGSTSAPKGVIHTHGQIIRNMRRQTVPRNLTAQDYLFSNSPWFWVGGLAFSLISTLVAGARLLCSSAEPGAMLDLLEAERPTTTNGVAATILGMAKHPSFASRDLSFIKGGNMHLIYPPAIRPADPELRYNMLGMTELGSVYLYGRHENDLPEAKRGSFGSPVEGVETRIVDPETGKDSTAGEMWVRGPNLMQGYYGRERHECFDDEGWFHTGDILTVDEDDDHYFKGRDGDIVRTSGAQVSPREVEIAISEVTGGRMSLVIGIPDPERDQLVTAVLIGDDPVDFDDLRTRLKTRLSPYKIPRKFLVMDEKDLPMMSSGKVDLRRLVEIASAG
jgi:acyl-CoA synthetase (AMP-forming)/AMP-acid ligase II